MDGYLGLEPARPRFGEADRGERRTAAPARDKLTPKPLVFLHIPKTAGTSLIELLARNFAAGETLRMTDIHRPLDDLATDIEVALADGMQLISGHFPYRAIAPLEGRVNAFTLLRDPVDRVVSLYRFWRIQSPEQAGGAASRFACHLARTLDFDAFLDCEHPLIVSATRNEMCKALAPAVGGESDVADCDTLFSRARTTLERMKFGLVERMPDSLRLLSHRLGLHLIGPVCLNAQEHPDLLRPTPEQVQHILRRNLDDVALYEHASRLFDRALQQLEIEQLYRAFGDGALSPLTAEAGGQFRWDAAMPVSGSGWNDRETLGCGTCYRFTSSPETVIHLPNPMPGHDLSVVLKVAFFNNDVLINGRGRVALQETIDFALNGRPVQAQIRASGAEGTSFVLQASGAALPEPFLSLSMRSKFGLPPSLFGSPDRRNLLAAVTCITLAPQKR